MKLNIREEQQCDFQTIHTLIKCAFENEQISDHTEHDVHGQAHFAPALLG